MSPHYYDGPLKIRQQIIELLPAVESTPKVCYFYRRIKIDVYMFRIDTIGILFLGRTLVSYVSMFLSFANVQFWLPSLSEEINCRFFQQLLSSSNRKGSTHILSLISSKGNDISLG